MVPRLIRQLATMAITSPELTLAQQHIRLAATVTEFSTMAIVDALACGQPVRLTYLNPEKLLHADLDIYENMMLRVDGRYLAWLFGKAFGTRIERASFDFSSLADKVFSTMETSVLSLAIIGAKDEHLAVFADVLNKRYKLDIRYIRNGYMEAVEYSTAIDALKDSGSDVVLVGMGGTKQDEFAARIASEIPTISVFTCGAFISQTAAGAGDYYPALFKVLDVRWLYRFMREPRTILRVVKYYPRYFFRFHRDRALSARSDRQA